MEKIGNIEFVLIPSGSFIMGSPAGYGDKDEHPLHAVTIKQFWMSISTIEY
jgi:formylglycine-generating enzyme required for sulfatase activity